MVPLSLMLLYLIYLLFYYVTALQYLRFPLFEMYVNVVFVIRRLYSAVSLTLVREQRLIRIIASSYYYLRP